MSTTNVTELRKNLFNTLDNVIEYNDSVTVNTRKGNAVILSEEDYNGMVETIYLLSQKGLLKKIKEGEKEDPAKMAKYDPDEEWRFFSPRTRRRTRGFLSRLGSTGRQRSCSMSFRTIHSKIHLPTKSLSAIWMATIQEESMSNIALSTGSSRISIR